MVVSVVVMEVLEVGSGGAECRAVTSVNRQPIQLPAVVKAKAVSLSFVVKVKAHITKATEVIRILSNCDCNQVINYLNQ